MPALIFCTCNNFGFDPTKDAANLAKHGGSLAEAADIGWDSVWSWPDLRRLYGEPRLAGIGYIGWRRYLVVFTDRGDVRRMISLQMANAREVARHAKA